MAARKPTTTAIAAAFRAMHNASGIKKGDSVKIVRGFKDTDFNGYVANIGEIGEKYVKDFIGKTYEVTEVNADSFEVDHAYSWPFYSLEKVIDPKRIRINDEYTAVVADNGLTADIGCQKVEFSAVVALLDAMNQAQLTFKPKAVVRKKPAARRRAW